MRIRTLMQRALAISLLTMCLLIARTAEAQDPPPRIGLFVVDLRGTIPTFGDGSGVGREPRLESGRAPGMGLGVSLGANVYVARIGPVTCGVGGEAMIGRSHSGATAATDQSGVPAERSPKEVQDDLATVLAEFRQW